MASDCSSSQLASFFRSRNARRASRLPTVTSSEEGYFRLTSRSLNHGCGHPGRRLPRFRSQFWQPFHSVGNIVAREAEGSNPSTHPKIKKLASQTHSPSLDCNGWPWLRPEFEHDRRREVHQILPETFASTSGGTARLGVPDKGVGDQGARISKAP